MKILPISVNYKNCNKLKVSKSFGKDEKKSSNIDSNSVLGILDVQSQNAKISAQIESKKPLVIYYENSEQIKEREFFDGSLEEYSPNGVLIRRVFDNGCEQRFYKKKRLSFESFENGTWKSYYPDGTMYAQQLKDGTYVKYSETGDVEYICHPDNSEIEYLFDEGLIFERNSQKCIYSFAHNNKLAAEIYPNGYKRIYRENGTLKYEMFPNGEQFKYSKDGIPRKIQGIDIKETIELIKERK